MQTGENERLEVTLATRFSPSTAAKIAAEAKRRSDAAGVTVKPSTVVRALVDAALARPA